MMTTTGRHPEIVYVATEVYTGGWAIEYPVWGIELGTERVDPPHHTLLREDSVVAYKLTRAQALAEIGPRVCIATLADGIRL